MKKSPSAESLQRLTNLYERRQKEVAKKVPKESEPAMSSAVQSLERKQQLHSLAVAFVEFRARNQETGMPHDPTPLKDLENLPPEKGLLAIDFDLDEETDELIVIKVIFQGKRVKPFQWYRWLNLHNDKESTYITRLVTDVTDIADIVELEPLEYEIPDFPSVLKLTKQSTTAEKKLNRDIQHHYFYHNGPQLSQEFDKLGYGLLFTDLLSIWLHLHDGIYLEKKYGLKRVPSTPKVPYPLRTDEDLINYLISPLKDTRVCAFDPWGHSPDRANIMMSIRELEENRNMLQNMSDPVFQLIGFHTFTLDPEFPLLRDTEALFNEYSKRVFSELTFFVDMNHYTTRSDAVEALFRIRHFTDLSEIAAVAPPEGAVSGAMAEILPRAAGFSTKKQQPASYTYTEAETRWRKICLSGNPTKAQVKELQAIAKALDLKTRAKNSQTLCDLISKQYEVEFGERGRLREVGEEVIPLKQSPVKSSASAGVPKRPMSAYMHFAEAAWSRIRAENPELTFREVSKAIVIAWDELGAKDKKKYGALAVKDKLRYEKEKEVYAEKGKEEEEEEED